MSIEILHALKSKDIRYQKSKMHSHPFWQLELILENEVSCILSDSTLKIEPSHMLIIPPNTLHRFIYPKTSSFISIKFTYDEKDKPANLLLLSTPFAKKVLLSIDAILNKPITLNHEKELLAYHLKTLFSYICSNEYKEESDKETSFTSLVISKIQSFNGKKVTIDKLANSFAYTRSHLSKKFKAQTNVTLKTVIDKERIEFAKKMLIYSDLTIQDIAVEMEFLDISSFSRFFKKHTKISPKNYRLSDKID